MKRPSGKGADIRKCCDRLWNNLFIKKKILCSSSFGSLFVVAGGGAFVSHSLQYFYTKILLLKLMPVRRLSFCSLSKLGMRLDCVCVFFLQFTHLLVGIAVRL